MLLKSAVRPPQRGSGANQLVGPTARRVLHRAGQAELNWEQTVHASEHLPGDATQVSGPPLEPIVARPREAQGLKSTTPALELNPSGSTRSTRYIRDIRCIRYLQRELPPVGQPVRLHMLPASLTSCIRYQQLHALHALRPLRRRVQPGRLPILRRILGRRRRRAHHAARRDQDAAPGARPDYTRLYATIRDYNANWIRRDHIMIRCDAAMPSPYDVC